MTKEKWSVEITGSDERPIIRVPWVEDGDVASGGNIHIVFEHPEHPLLVTLPVIELPDGFMRQKGRRLSILGAVWRLLEATDTKALGVGKSQPLSATFDLED